jgi:hypothetical protein
MLILPLENALSHFMLFYIYAICGKKYNYYRRKFIGFFHFKKLNITCTVFMQIEAVCIFKLHHTFNNKIKNINISFTSNVKASKLVFPDVSVRYFCVQITLVIVLL